MREIIFRGFHPCDGPETIVVDGEKVQGKWVEGYLYVTHTAEYEIGGYCEEYNIERYTYNVLPSTVGQYTGLTDRNGKRIFEGSVLRITKDALPDFSVQFVDYGWWLCFNGKNVAIICPENINGLGAEVIGTVFDEGALT